MFWNKRSHASTSFLFCKCKKEMQLFSVESLLQLFERPNFCETEMVLVLNKIRGWRLTICIFEITRTIYSKSEITQQSTNYTYVEHKKFPQAHLKNQFTTNDSVIFKSDETFGPVKELYVTTY